MHQSHFKDRALRLIHGLDACVRAVCSALLLSTIGVLLVSLGLNVVVRYLFQGGGLGWATELPAYLFPWMIAAGLVMAVQQGSHITIDLLGGLLRGRGRAWLALGVNLLVAVAYVVLFRVIVGMMEIVAIERSALLGIPLSWAYAALAFAAFGTALCSLLIAARLLLLGEAALPPGLTEETQP